MSPGDQTWPEGDLREIQLSMETKNLTETYGLVEHHRTDLEITSGISPEVIAERGYFSADQPEPLLELGFAEYQIRTPALVLPVRGVDGQFRFARIRPDHPRQDSNNPKKVIKYEQPSGTPLALDVPRAAQPHLADPTKRLWVVEGEKKADAVVS